MLCETACGIEHHEARSNEEVEADENETKSKLRCMSTLCFSPTNRFKSAVFAALFDIMNTISY